MKSPPSAKPTTPPPLTAVNDEKRDADRDERRSEGVHRLAGTQLHAALRCLEAVTITRHGALSASRGPRSTRTRRAVGSSRSLRGDAEHDDLRAALLRLGERSRPRRSCRGRGGRRPGRRTCRRWRIASSSSSFARRSSSGRSASSGSSSGTSITVSATSAGAALRGQPARDVERVVGGPARDDRGRAIRRYSSASAAPNAGGALHGLPEPGRARHRRR